MATKENSNRCVKCWTYHNNMTSLCPPMKEDKKCCSKCIKHPESDLVCKGFCPCHQPPQQEERVGDFEVCREKCMATPHVHKKEPAPKDKEIWEERFEEFSKNLFVRNEVVEDGEYMEDRDVYLSECKGVKEIKSFIKDLLFEESEKERIVFEKAHKVLIDRHEDLLHSERSELVKEILGKLPKFRDKKQMMDENPNYASDETHDAGYNRALFEVTQLLKELL